MKIVLFVLGGLALLVVAFIAWRYYCNDGSGGADFRRPSWAESLPSYRRFCSGAGILVSRTWNALGHLGRRAKCYWRPSYRSGGQTSSQNNTGHGRRIAEGDLAFWLAHPNELAGRSQDEMELMATVPAPGAAGRRDVLPLPLPHKATALGCIRRLAGGCSRALRHECGVPPRRLRHVQQAGAV